MAQPHRTKRRLPPPQNTQSYASSSGLQEGRCYSSVLDPTVTFQRVPEITGFYRSGPFSVSSEPSTDVNFQEAVSNYEPYLHSNPSQISVFNKLADISTGLTSNVNLSGANNPFETINHGYHRPFPDLPVFDLCYDHDPSAQVSQYPSERAYTIASAPPSTVEAVNRMIHDGTPFHEMAYNMPPSHMSTSRSSNKLQCDIVSPYNANPGLDETLIPEDRLEPNPESHRSSPGTSSSQIRFRCHYPLCGRTYSRRQDRDRHARVHDNMKEFVCPVEGCSKDFNRRDKLDSHLKKGHKYQRNLSQLAA